MKKTHFKTLKKIHFIKSTFVDRYNIKTIKNIKIIKNLLLNSQKLKSMRKIYVIFFDPKIQILKSY